MKDLFDAWKAQQKDGPRLDRGPEEELWHRFSHARTTFDRHRRQHFAQLETTPGRGQAGQAGAGQGGRGAVDLARTGAPTSAAYKRLMDRWRARRPRLAQGRRRAVGAVPGRPGRLLRRPQRGRSRPRRRSSGPTSPSRRRCSSRPRRSCRSPTWPRPRRRCAAIQDRWEAAGKVPRARHGAGREADPPGRAGRARRRGRALEADQPRGPGPRAERGRPARGGAGRRSGSSWPRPRPRATRRRSPRPRPRSRPGRCGWSRPAARWTSSAAGPRRHSRAVILPRGPGMRVQRCGCTEGTSGAIGRATGGHRMTSPSPAHVARAGPVPGRGWVEDRAARGASGTPLCHGAHPERDRDDPHAGSGRRLRARRQGAGGHPRRRVDRRASRRSDPPLLRREHRRHRSSSSTSGTARTPTTTSSTHQKEIPAS